MLLDVYNDSGSKLNLRNYRVVNCLATCAMPWPIDIEKLT